MDNTGNVREWPSEEVLAYYLVQRSSQTAEQSVVRKVIELGAGKSGLIGLVSAALMHRRQEGACEVVITDGNDRCVQSLQANVALNLPQFEQVLVRACPLLWSRNEDPEPVFGKFDQILIADCLFFENFHIDLVYTLRQLAHGETEVLIAAPERG